MSGKIKLSIGQIFIICIVLTVIPGLSACRSSERVVEVKHVVHDTLYVSLHQRDSIYLHDSTHIQQKGDTVYEDRWHYEYRDRLQTDTLFQAVHDSIPYKVIVDKPVPYIPTWGKVLIFIGVLAIMIFILWVAWLILRAKIKK